MADINFYFDPVCPFAWMTSKWVRQVQAARDYTVDWRFISLRLLNSHIDYDAHFPPEYEAGHTAGLRLLRMASRVRQEHGRDAVADLYAVLGAEVFDREPEPGRAGQPGRPPAGQESGRRSTCTSPGKPPPADSSARNDSSVSRNARTAWVGVRSARRARATVR